MSDAVRRALRTYLQSAIGIFLGLWAMSGVSPDEFSGISDLTILGKLAAGSLIGGIPALLSFVQNALEDAGTVPSVLKANASSGARPVTRDPAEGDRGESVLGLIGIVLLAGAAIVALLSLADVVAASLLACIVVGVIGLLLLLLSGRR